MTKKIISVLCALAMVLMLAACAKTPASSAAPTPASSAEAPSSAAPAKKDPVTLVIWYRNAVGEQEYTKQVAAKLNEILAKTAGYEHVTFELHPVADMATDFPLAQASKLPMDIVSTPMGINFATEVTNGSFIALDDYLAKYPEVTAELPEWLLKLGQKDGKTYMVPNYQQGASQFYFCTPKQYLDMSGYTEDQIRNIFWKGTVDEKFDFYEKFLLAIRKATGKETKWIQGLTDRREYYAPGNEMTFVDWENSYYWDEKTNTIGFTASREDVVKAYSKAGEFYAKGYIHPDIATMKGENLGGKNFLNDESWVFGWAQGIGPDDFMSAQATASNGMEMVYISTSDHVWINNTWSAGGLAISSTCKNPEEAVAALALLENSKYQEFYNTLCYGLEGKHYEWVDKSANTIKTLEFDGSQGNADCSYTCWKWTVGNTFNAWLNQSMSKELQDYIKNEINEGPKTKYIPLAGLMFDTSGVETEMSQVIAINKEYASLKNGVKGNDAAKYYEEYKKQLENAGLNKILDELNKQASDFLASKK